MTVELHLARDSSVSISNGGFARPPVFGMERDFTDSPLSQRRSRQSSIAHNTSTGGRSSVTPLTTITASEIPIRSDQFAVPASVPRVPSAEMGRLNAVSTSSSRVGTDRGVSQFTDSQEAVFRKNSDRCSDNNTPPHMRWAESLVCLLQDREGVRLFKQFLDTESDSAALDFWFACTGLQMVAEDDQKRVDNLVKLIFKKYIKSNQVKLKPDMCKRIIERLKGRSSHFDRSMYEESKIYIEQMMSTDTYPLFLNSEIYLQYVQSYSETNNSSAASTRPVSAIALPTLPEDEELRQEDIAGTVALSLTSNNLAATIRTRNNNSEGLFAVPSRVPNPYHVHYHNSYVPPSAQDSASEMQSLSSGATDDTVSQADSAIDGRDARKWRQHVMRKSVNANRHVDTQQPFIPRTQMELPADHSLAVTDPERFVALITEKLRKWCEEGEKQVEVREKMRLIEPDSGAEDDMTGLAAAGGDRRLNTTNVGDRSGLHLSLMASMMTGGDRDDDESILDNHMSRIWHSSGQTPCRSPPPAAAAASASLMAAYSPGRARRSLLSLPASQVPHPAIADVVLSGRPRRRETVHGAALRLPVDEGQGSRTGSLRSRYQQQDLVDSAYSSQVNEPVWSRSQPIQGAAITGPSGATISRVRESDTAQHASLAYDPASDKVSKWIMSNEVHTDKPAQYSTDVSEKSSTRRSAKSNTALRGVATGSRREVGDAGWMAPASPSVAAATGDGRSHRHLLNTSTQSHVLSAHVSSTQHHDLSLPLDVNRHGNVVQQRDAMPPPSGPIHHFKMPPSATIQTLASFDRALSAERQPATGGQVTGAVGQSITVAYYWCGEPVPYRSNLSLTGAPVTLAHVKQVIAKKGNLRYFFKTFCDEFEGGIVHMEVSDDNAAVPLYDGKIICKVEKLD